MPFQVIATDGKLPNMLYLAMKPHMYNLTSMEDVLVIGAGPIGSYTARALARQGYRVTVLEKRPYLGSPVCCAGIISPQCAKMLNLEKLPTLSSFSGARIFSPRGRTIELERSSTQALAVDRGFLDLAMAESAQSAGAKFIFGSKASRVEAGKEDITVYTDNNSMPSFKSRLVVVAAGFSPRLTAALHLGKPADFAIGAQAQVEIPGSMPLTVFTSGFFTPGFFSWLEPLGNGIALAGLLCRKNTATHFNRFLHYLKETSQIISTGKPQYRGVSLKPLSRTHGDRVLVIGDAAGQVKPITGGGIFYGLKAADCAVNIIRSAFKQGDFSARELAGYQKEWKKVIGRDIRLGRLARNIYEKLDERRIENAFNAIIHSGLAQKLSEDESLRFDDHGSVVLKIIRTPAFYRTVASIMAPVNN